MRSRALQDLLLQSHLQSLQHARCSETPPARTHEAIRTCQSCPLCSKHVVGALSDHLDQCEQNLISCPHCFTGVSVAALDGHVLTCPSNFRCCYVCHCRLASVELAEHLQTCGKGKIIRMHHGTSLAAARSIMRDGFQPSTKGLLGAGVYVTKDPDKARLYGPVIIECDVHVGSVAVISKRHHNLQKCWAAHGFDSAWIPPHSGVVSSGLEEHCVADPRRVVPVSMLSAVRTTQGS